MDRITDPPKKSSSSPYLATDYLPARRGRLDTIRNTVELAYSLEPKSLKWQTNEYRIARPRHVAYYLARKMSHASLPAIGRFFALRHHSSVLYGIRRIEAAIAESAEVAAFIANLELDILETEREADGRMPRISPGAYLPKIAG